MMNAREDGLALISASLASVTSSHPADDLVRYDLDQCLSLRVGCGDGAAVSAGTHPARRRVTPGRHSALSHSSHSFSPKRGSGMPRFCLILSRSWSWVAVMVLIGLPNCEATKDGAAVGLENLHFEIGVLHTVVAPGDHAVVGHKDSVVLIHQSATSWPISGVPGVR